MISPGWQSIAEHILSRTFGEIPSPFLMAAIVVGDAFSSL